MNDKQLQSYTPSVLLKKGQTEVKVFNNVYTQTAFYDSEGTKRGQGGRVTYYTGILEFLRGISTNFNAGFNVYLRSVRFDSEGSSPFGVFQFENSAVSRVAVTAAGPRVKFSPFVKLEGFSVETSLLFPLVDDGESNPWLDFDAYTIANRFFYDMDLGPLFGMFAEFDTWLRLNKFDNERSNFETPIKLFVSYFPNKSITLYMANEYSITWGETAAYYFQTGAGAKWQFLPQMEIEMLYTVFPFGKDRGAGQTYNLGFRVIR